MSEHAAGKLLFPIKIALYVYIAVAALCGAGLAGTTQGQAQSPTAHTEQDQKQIGLKLDATKAPADVMVIDHVEKPSEN